MTAPSATIYCTISSFIAQSKRLPAAIIRYTRTAEGVRDIAAVCCLPRQGPAEPEGSHLKRASKAYPHPLPTSLWNTRLPSQTRPRRNQGHNRISSFSSHQVFHITSTLLGPLPPPSETPLTLTTPRRSGQARLRRASSTRQFKAFSPPGRPRAATHDRQNSLQTQSPHLTSGRQRVQLQTTHQCLLQR